MPFNFYIPGADPNNSNFDWSQLGQQVSNPYFDNSYSDNTSSNPFDFSISGSQPGNLDFSSMFGQQNQGSSPSMPNRLSGILSNMSQNTAQGKPDFASMSQANQSSPIYDAYRKAISQAPTPDQYDPSIWRRIGAAAAGAGAGLATKNPLLGMNVAENVVNQPYNRALQNWEARTGKLKLAADEERQTQQGRFNQWKDTQKIGLDMTEQQRKVLDTLSNVERRNSQNSVDAARIKQINFDMQNPGIDLQKNDDGTLVAINKKTGAVVKDYGKVNMSAQEVEQMKAGYQLRNQLANTAAQGQNQQNLENTRFGHEQALEDQREKNRETLKAVPDPRQGGINQLEFNRRQQKAVTDILRDPRASTKGWDKFYTQNNKGQIIPNEDVIKQNPQQWQEFQTAIQKYMQMMAGRYQQGY